MEKIHIQIHCQDYLIMKDIQQSLLMLKNTVNLTGLNYIRMDLVHKYFGVLTITIMMKL